MISCIMFAFWACLISMHVVDAYKPVKYVGLQYCKDDSQKKCTPWDAGLYWRTHSDNRQVCLETCQNSGYNSYTYSEVKSEGWCERGDAYPGYNTGGKRCGDGGSYGAYIGIGSSNKWKKYQAYCPSGKYHSSKNGCTSCGAGKHNPWDDFQLSACYDCNAGQYQNGNGAKKCTPCPEAQYQSSKGQTYCISCPKGKYNYRKGLTKCDDCFPGRYGDATGVTYWQAGCKLCQTGQYQSSKGQTSCTACEPGKYAGNKGRTACVACPTGKYTESNNAAACKNCDTGQYQNIQEQTACKTCPKGYMGSSLGLSLCEICPTGEFQDQVSQTSCKTCPAGFFRKDLISVECDECPRGKTSEAGSESCCESGTFSVASQASGGNAACHTCAAGYYAPADAYYLPISDVAQTTQTSSSLTTSGKTTYFAQCATCAYGYYQDEVGQYSCKQCPSGKFTNPYGVFGTADANWRNTSCRVRCDIKTDFTTTEKKCGPGLFWDYNDAICPSSSPGECVLCSPGYYKRGTSGRTDFFPAHSGTVIPMWGADKDNRRLCNGGDYQDQEKQSSCKKCPIGYYGNTVSLSTYDDRLVNRNCLACPTGKWSSTYFEDETLVLSDTDWETAFTYLGAGQCRGVGGTSPAWSVKQTADHEKARKECLTDESCVAYTRLVDGTFKYFCKKVGGLCTEIADVGDAYTTIAGDFNVRPTIVTSDADFVTYQCPVGYIFNEDSIRCEVDLSFDFGLNGTSVCYAIERRMSDVVGGCRVNDVTNMEECGQWIGYTPWTEVPSTSRLHISTAAVNVKNADVQMYIYDYNTCVKEGYLLTEEECKQVARDDNCPAAALEKGFKKKVSGTCDDESGWDYVKSENECKAAAKAFGYTDDDVGSPLNLRKKDIAPYCSLCDDYQNSFNRHYAEVLYNVDTDDMSTVKCSKERPCICKTSSSFTLNDASCGFHTEDSETIPFGCSHDSRWVYKWRSGSTGNYAKSTFTYESGESYELHPVCGTHVSTDAVDIICQICPKGYFSDTLAATRRSECRMCPSGYFSSSDGATFCSACPEGTYSPDTGAIDSDTCKNCPAGYFQDETGHNERKDCTICPEGRFSPYEGQPNIFACILCPHGFYSSEAGSLFCEKCSDTSITDDVGSVDDTYCKECPIGKFNMESEECVQCPKGWFKDSDTCRECPVGKVSRVHDADACEDCVYQDESGRDRCKLCPTTSYVKNNMCLQCPSGQFAETFNAVTCVSCPEGRYDATQPMDSTANCVRCPDVSSACYGDLSHINQNNARKSVIDLCKEAARDVYGITDNFETRNDKDEPYGCFVEDRVRIVLNLNGNAPKVFDKANTMGLCLFNGQSVAARAGTCSGMTGGPTRVVEENQLFGGAVFTLSKEIAGVALDWHPLYSVQDGDACPIGQRGAPPSPCTNCSPGKYSRVFDKTSTGRLKSYMEAMRIGVSVKDYMYGDTISATGVNLVTGTNDVLESVSSINWGEKQDGWVTHISDNKYSTFDWTLTQCLDMCQKNSNCKAASWAPSTIDAAYVDKHKDAAELWSINTFQVRGVGSRSIKMEPLIDSFNGGAYYCSSSKKCSECQGDCYRDTDCEDGLKCFLREGANAPMPPGCTNTDDMHFDYCYDPNKNHYIGWSPGWSHASRNETRSASWGAPAYINSRSNVFHSAKDSTLTRVRKRLHNWMREQKLNNTVVETDDVKEPDVAHLDSDWWRDVHITGTEPVDEWLNMDRHINNVLPDGTYSNYMVPRNFFVGENLEPAFFDSSGARESLQPKYGSCFLSQSQPVKDVVYVIYQENTDTSNTWNGIIKGLEPGASYTVEWDVLMSGLSGDHQKVNSVTMNRISLGGCNPKNTTACDFVTCPETGVRTYTVTANALGEIDVEATYQFHNAECSCDRDIQYGRCVPRVLELDDYTITRAALRFRLTGDTTLHPGFWLSCQRYGKTMLVDENAGLSCRAHLVHTYVKEGCISCPPGKFSEDVASSSCKDCPQGWHSEIGSHRCTLCPLCPAGKIQAPNCQCDFCPQGQVPIIDVGCKACEPGKYAMYGTSECKECAPGRKAPNAGTGSPCEACICDRTKKILAASLEEHTDRTTCNQIQCQECEAGHYQDVINHLAQCKTCGTHQYQSQTGQYSCQSCDGCAEGKTRRQLAKTASGACENSDSCSDCTTGHYCSRDDNIERECPRGRYQNEAAKTSCKECPVGRYSGVGKTECTLCDPGKTSESGSGYPEHCLYCPSDKFEANNECISCPQGRIHPPGTNTCECTSGWFESNEYCAQWPTEIAFNNQKNIANVLSDSYEPNTHYNAVEWMTFPLDQSTITSNPIKWQPECMKDSAVECRDSFGYVKIDIESIPSVFVHFEQRTYSSWGGGSSSHKTTQHGYLNSTSDLFQFTCAAGLDFSADTVMCEERATYFVPPSE